MAFAQRSAQHGLGRDPLTLATLRRIAREGPAISVDKRCVPGLEAGLEAIERIVADGTDDAARRLERVLWNDPATGVMRHADAGYDIAVDCAREQGLDLPMLP